jgi:stress response protein YsnF
MRTVVGLFEGGAEARQTIEELAELGFASQSISVVTNLNSRSAIEETSGRPALQSTLRTMSLNDVGTVAASGPLSEERQRPAEHGLAGLLQRLGLSSELAAHYATGVERGETLESITVDDADAERVAAVMKRHAAGALKADVVRSEASKRAVLGGNGGIGGLGAGAASAVVGQAVSSRIQPEGTREKREGHVFADEERTIPIYREELHVGKREVERGVVRVTTHIVERPYSEQVLLREEHVDVTRRPADRLVGSGESEFREGDIEMTEIGEEPIGAKQTRLVEEVIIRKHVADRTATVGDTVRSTEVDVSTFDTSEYRKDFDKQKMSDATFEEHIPAFKFGERFASAGASSRWEDIENDARNRWEAQRPGTWDKFKDSVRSAYLRSTKRSQ